MNRNMEDKKEFAKTILEAFAVITAVSLLFSVLTESVLATEIKKAEVIPTSYNVTPVSTKATSVPDGYTKADYIVVSDPLVENQPTSKDISKEEAAELGAQKLWEIWGADLKGATIYTSYQPAMEDYPRATWFGEVRFGERKKTSELNPGTYGYFFSLDAVTGETFTAGLGRTLAKKVSLDLDSALAKHPEEYEKLARELAEKYNFVDGKVQSSEYNSQGYEGNDPDITIYVTGVNGGTAALTFSRYDKAFTGLIYPECFAINERATEKMLADLEKKIKQERPQNKDSKSESTELVVIS